MRRSGVVSRLDVSLVQVDLDPLVSCGECSRRRSCGLEIVPLKSTPITVECRRTPSLEYGQRVSVQIPEPFDGWLRLVFFAYCAPTLLMVLGAIAGYLVGMYFGGEQFANILSVGGFLLGCSCGLIAWRRVQKDLVQSKGTKQRSSELLKAIIVSAE